MNSDNDDDIPSETTLENVNMVNDHDEFEAMKEMGLPTAFVPCGVSMLNKRVLCRLCNRTLMTIHFVCKSLNILRN